MPSIILDIKDAANLRGFYHFLLWVQKISLQQVHTYLEISRPQSSQNATQGTACQSNDNFITGSSIQDPALIYYYQFVSDVERLGDFLSISNLKLLTKHKYFTPEGVSGLLVKVRDRSLFMAGGGRGQNWWGGGGKNFLCMCRVCHKNIFHKQSFDSAPPPRL